MTATDLQIIDHARYSYLAASVDHDPSAFAGIDNVLLLLLAGVKRTLADGESADNAAGLLATDWVCCQLRSERRKSRALRRWISRQRWLLVSLGEYMAYGLVGRPLLSQPARPRYGDCRLRQITLPTDPHCIGEWAVDYTEQPLPAWYIANLMRLPPKRNLSVDVIAHAILTRQHN